LEFKASLDKTRDFGLKSFEDLFEELYGFRAIYIRDHLIRMRVINQQLDLWPVKRLKEFKVRM
jgi:hypothetical protein